MRVHQGQSTFVIRDLPREDYRFTVSLCSCAAVTVCRATPAEHALCYGGSLLLRRYEEKDGVYGFNNCYNNNALNLEEPEEWESEASYGLMY